MLRTFTRADTQRLDGRNFTGNGSLNHWRMPHQSLRVVHESELFSNDLVCNLVLTRCFSVPHAAITTMTDSRRTTTPLTHIKCYSLTANTGLGRPNLGWFSTAKIKGAAHPRCFHMSARNAQSPITPAFSQYISWMQTPEFLKHTLQMDANGSVTRTLLWLKTSPGHC